MAKEFTFMRIFQNSLDYGNGISAPGSQSASRTAAGLGISAPGSQSAPRTAAELGISAPPPAGRVNVSFLILIRNWLAGVVVKTGARTAFMRPLSCPWFRTLNVRDRDAAKFCYSFLRKNIAHERYRL